MSYPEHIQWIVDNRSKDLTKALSQDNSYETIDNPLNIFLDADPTDKKKLTEWLVDMYINGGFKWEDIQDGANSKVFYTLSIFIKHKSKLITNHDLQLNTNPKYKIINNNDYIIISNQITKYINLWSIYKDIEYLIKSEKPLISMEQEEQERAYEESDILVKYDAGEFTTNAGEFTKNSLTVVIPKTEYASKWWGKGTQWCTSDGNNNKCEPLIIIINGVKTRLHVLVNKNRSIQFMDEYNHLVKTNFVEENWNLLSPIMKWAVKQNGNALRYIPTQFKTEELRMESARQDCLKEVRKNGYALYTIPENLKTAEI